MRIAYHAIIIQNKELLILDKKGSLILPGGKPNMGESYDKCIEREIKEELSGTKVNVGEYYGDFSGITPHSKRLLTSKTYFCFVEGKIGKPSAEIRGKIFVNSGNLKEFNLSEISKKTLDSLIEGGFIV